MLAIIFYISLLEDTLRSFIRNIFSGVRNSDFTLFRRVLKLMVATTSFIEKHPSASNIIISSSDEYDFIVVFLRKTIIIRMNTRVNEVVTRQVYLVKN